MVPHVSYSSWQLFRNGCEQRWKLDYLEGRRSENFGVHLDFGTSIHEAIENWKTRRLPALSLEGAISHFKHVFDSLYTTHSPKYGERDFKTPKEQFLSAGENVLTHFHECLELETAEVLYNEHELYLPMERPTGSAEVKFKGFIDMVIKTTDKRGKTVLYVCDFKSCSWGWTREKKSDRELQFQLFLYKHFLCKKFNLDPTQVRCAFVLLKKRPRGNDSPIEWFPVSAGPVSVQRALDELSHDVSRMEELSVSNTFRKNRSKCVNDFGETCPYKSTEQCPDDPA